MEKKKNLKKAQQKAELLAKASSLMSNLKELGVSDEKLAGIMASFERLTQSEGVKTRVSTKDNGESESE